MVSAVSTQRKFLEGLPQRYLQTRLPEQIRNHFLMALNLDKDNVQLDLRPMRDAGADPLREVRIGRMRTLERMGLAEPAGHLSP